MGGHEIAVGVGFFADSPDHFRRHFQLAGHRDSLIGGEDAGPNFGSGFDFIAKAGIKISQTAYGTDRGDAA